MGKLSTAEIDMVKTITEHDIVDLTNAAWAICSIYHIVLKASPGASIFVRDMMFEMPFLAD